MSLQDGKVSNRRLFASFFFLSFSKIVFHHMDVSLFFIMSQVMSGRFIYIFS